MGMLIKWKGAIASVMTGSFLLCSLPAEASDYNWPDNRWTCCCTGTILGAVAGAAAGFAAGHHRQGGKGKPGPRGPEGPEGPPGPPWPYENGYVENTSNFLTLTRASTGITDENLVFDYFVYDQTGNLIDSTTGVNMGSTADVATIPAVTPKMEGIYYIRLVVTTAPGAATTLGMITITTDGSTSTGLIETPVRTWALKDVYADFFVFS